MIDLDEVRKEIAIKYGFVPDKDDPAFIPVMAFDTILEKAVADLNAHQEANLKALLNALQRGNTEAKITGGMVITDATSHVRDEVNKAVAAAMSKGRDEIKELLSNYMAGMDNMRYEAATAKNMSYIAMGVSVVAMVGCLLITLY